MMQSQFIVFPDARFTWRTSCVTREEGIFTAYYSGIITPRDIEMLRFLVEHKVATISQLTRTCYKEKNKIGERLRRFSRWRLLDSFSWVDGKNQAKPVVYCPGPGGLTLLRAIYPEENHDARYEWYKREVYDAAALLLANEFFIRAGAALCGFTAEPCYKMGSAKLMPTASFMAGSTVLVMRVLRGTEHANRFAAELPLYEQLIEGTAGFDKHSTKPVLLLICESEQQALNLAAFIAQNSTITRFRISTDSDILFKPPHLAFSTFEEERLVVRAANIFKAPFDSVFHTSPT